MAFNNNNLFLISFLILALPCIAQTTSKSKAFVVPVSKHESYDLHIAQIIKRNPLRSTKFILDISANSSWVDCETYNHTTYNFVKCKSNSCNLAKSKRCDKMCFSADFASRCINNACINNPVNLVDTTFIGAVTEDLILVQSTDGSKLGQAAKVPGFIFSCVPTWFTPGVPDGVEGLASFGTSRIGLPTQLANVLKTPRKFGMCLSPIRKAKGFIIFGDGPYITYPNVDVSKNLVYTPLISNPITILPDSTVKDTSSEYFIGVKSINVNGKTLKFNTTLLSFTKQGRGGTKIVTTEFNTKLETPIYNAVTEAFIKLLPNAKRVAGYAPYGVCFSPESIPTTHLGPAVPTIDFVFENQKVWRIYGANSMVRVDKDNLCLGFVDYDNRELGQSIIIGARLLEDNLVQFDLEKSRVGFSSSLLAQNTTCASFDFSTSHA